MLWLLRASEAMGKRKLEHCSEASSGGVDARVETLAESCYKFQRSSCAVQPLRGESDLYEQSKAVQGVRVVDAKPPSEPRGDFPGIGFVGPAKEILFNDFLDQTFKQFPSKYRGDTIIFSVMIGRLDF